MTANASRFLLMSIAMLGAFAMTSGCATNPEQGYTVKPLHDTSIATVAIPIFANDTFDRGVEFELTDALIKEVLARTPYKVTDESEADSILIGRIVDVDRHVLSNSRNTRLAEEVVVAITVDFEWREQRTGQTLVTRQQFTGHGLFIPSDPTGESIEIGQFAAVQQLARDLVEEIQAAW